MSANADKFVADRNTLLADFANFPGMTRNWAIFEYSDADLKALLGKLEANAATLTTVGGKLSQSEKDAINKAAGQIIV